MPDSVVCDTSVLAAFIFKEDNYERAAGMLADAHLYGPPLMAYELASVCRKKILRSPEHRGYLIDSLTDGLAFQIRWVEVDQVEALDLALRHDLTTYDAAFLWIARTLGIPLLTFDDTLRRVATD